MINSSKNIFTKLQQLRIRNFKTTVDTDDIIRHSKYMKEWWNQDGIIKPLHTFNYLRVPYIRDDLLRPSMKNNSLCLKGTKILDVGCGGGILSEGLAKLGAEVTGIDANKDLIAVAQHHANDNTDLDNNRPIYVSATIEDYSDVNCDKYDAVVSSEVIEHVNEKELFVKSCVRATKPGGKIFFTTPSRTRLAQFSYIFLNERIFGAIPKGTHQYEKFMTSNELKVLLEINDCTVKSTRGIMFYPLRKEWKWSNHKLIMFAMEAIKKNG